MSTTDFMRVACIQPRLKPSVDECYSEIRSILNKYYKLHEFCDIACLPERWTPFFSDMIKNLQKERGEHYLFIKSLAQEFKLNILSGAIWEKRDDRKKPVITCYFFNNRGEEVGKQDKLHLYAMERHFFEPGKEINLFKLNGIYFSILICFDMAFFETPRLAVENGADILFTPTQIREEGMENWLIYLQARALENRIPIVACNTIGSVGDKIFPGNSKIISFVKGFRSPSKLKIVEDLKCISGFIYDDVDLNFPKKIRESRIKERIDANQIKIIKF